MSALLENLSIGVNDDYSLERVFNLNRRKQKYLSFFYKILIFNKMRKIDKANVEERRGCCVQLARFHHRSNQFEYKMDYQQ
jgi:hypothetical protein